MRHYNDQTQMHSPKQHQRGAGRLRHRWFMSAVCATAVASALAVAAPAEAAQPNPISGSTGTSYYESPTDRHVTTPNDTMQISLSTYPSGGMSWYCVKASTGVRFSNIVSITSHQTYTLEYY